MQREILAIVEEIRSQIQTFQMTNEETSLLYKIQLSLIGDNLTEFIDKVLEQLKITIIERNNDKCLCSWYFLYEMRFYLDLHFKVSETGYEVISIIHYEEDDNSDNDTASENEENHVSSIRNHYDYSDDEF